MLLANSQAFAQSPIVIDPVLNAVTIAADILENSNYNKIKDKQNAIEALQAATVATTTLINDWQKKIYNGLTTIKNNVQNAFQVYEAYKLLKKIYENEDKMIAEGWSNPITYALVVKAQEEMVTRAVTYYESIAALILKADSKMLMDAGERLMLLNKVLDDLRVLDAIAYSCYLKVHWAVVNGLFQTINPFSNIVNKDASIVKDILHGYKF
jgi:hypothetical protein